MFKRYKLVWLVSLLGALFYIFDSFIDSYILGKGAFIHQLLYPESLEIWWRLSIFMMSLLFGIYAQYLLNQAEVSKKQANTTEKFLDSIIENIPLMVFIKDRQDLRFVKINKAGENLIGQNRETLIGKSDTDFFPAEQAKFFIDKDQQVLKTKMPIDIPEEYLETESYGSRTLHTRKVPILDDYGDSAYLLGISEDITDQIKAKIQLIKEKERAERYLHITEAIIVGIDENECISLINRRGCEVLKCSEEDLIGQNWFDIAIPENERQNVNNIYKKIMANEIELTEHYENEIIAADGDVHYIAWHNTLQKSSTGEIEGVLSSGIDITYHKVMEDQLRLAGAVYKSTNQGVIVTDKNNKIISVNPAFSTITGYEFDDVIGKNPSHLKSGRNDESFYQELWKEVEGAGHWKGEIWDRRKNGEVFPAWHSISAISNESGELTHYVSVFSDITSIKEYQDSLDFLAHHDHLTSLPNRLMFNDRVDHALQRCTRDSTQVALLFLDLNDFKNINDTYGHTIGDQTLQIVAKRLKSLLREEDTVARLGGDEFLILIESHVSEENIKQVVTKIIDDVTHSTMIDGHEINIGVSIGIAIGPSGEQDVQSLISAADHAMYRAKNEGCNMYSF